MRFVFFSRAQYDLVLLVSNFQNPENKSRSTDDSSDKRVCNLVSTGAILLADIIPSMIVKAVVPFLPFHIE